MTCIDLAPDLSLQFLEVHVMRLDLLIRREMRRWQLAGQDSADPFRGQSLTDEQALAWPQRPFGVSWGQTIAESERESQSCAAAAKALETHLKTISRKAKKEKHQLRLLHLSQSFNLSQFELDALLYPAPSSIGRASRPALALSLRNGSAVDRGAVGRIENCDC